jgi:DNA-binding MarR family transcriptional regulator
MATTSDDALAAQWHELMGRYQRLTCTLDRELQAAHDLTASDFEVLEQLHDTTPVPKLRMHELGDRVHLTQSALSRLVARLEADGLVERVMCVEDRRSVFAKLTLAGQQLYDAARPTQREVLRTEGGECLAAVGSAFMATGAMAAG